MFVIISVLKVFSLSSQMNLSWANQIGGTNSDEAQSIATDSNGNVYVAGSFQGTVDFDNGIGTFTLTSAGATDGYVAKYDANGNFLNAVSFTNNLECKVYSLAIDNLDNVIVTGGFTGSVDFDPGSGVTLLVAGGYYDIFAVKLNSNLIFSWAYRFGYAGGDDYGLSAATDNNNSILLTGYFQGSNIDFDPGGAANYLSSQGAKDAFVLKLDANAGYIWAIDLGSSGTFQEVGQTIKADINGNVIVGGYFSSMVDFDPSASTQTLTSSGNYDAFIAKYSSAGVFVWAKNFSGLSNEVCYALQPDASGDVYCTGTFNGGTACDFDPGSGTFFLTSNGVGEDIFVAKLSSAGNFVWAKAMGGSGIDYGKAIALDGNTVYTSGYFNGVADFNPSTTTNAITTNGGADFFISKLDLSGNYINAYGYGASGNDYAHAICSPTTGVIYTAGTFSNTVDFDTGSPGVLLTSNGSNDAFFFKLNDNSIGIEELSNKSFAKIFPNPFTDGVELINAQKSEVSIFNILGQCVVKAMITESPAKLNLSQLSNGIYYIKIRNSSSSIQTSKIIKQ